MTDRFRELTPAEADAVFAGFLAERPAALAHLQEQVAADGQDPAVLDGSPSGLESLWRWLKRQLPAAPLEQGWRTDVERADGVAVPRWYRHEIAEERALSPRAVALLDGVLTHVGDVVERAAPGATWRRGHHPVPRWVDQNRPVLARGDVQIGAIRWVFGGARGHVLEPGSSPDESLRTGVERWVDALRAADEEPAAVQEPPLDVALAAEVSVEPGDEAGEWFVNLFDDVWVLVGQAAIDGLAEKLPGNVGVTAAELVDREVLAVQGRVDPAELHRWVVDELVRTAGGDR